MAALGCAPQEGAQVRVIGIALKMPSWTARIECLKHGRRRTQGQAMKG